MAQFEEKLSDELSTHGNSAETALAVIEKERFLDVKKSDLTAEDLYQAALDQMLRNTVGEQKPGEDLSRFDLQEQASFAGQLLFHKNTFEIGRKLLTFTYEQALGFYERRSERVSSDVNEVVKEIVKQMSAHESLRAAAIEIVFDPKTYGFNRASEKTEEFLRLKEAVNGFESDPLQADKLLTGETEDSWSVGRLLRKIGIQIGENQEESLQIKSKINVSSLDSDTLFWMGSLTFELIKGIKDSDVLLSEKLLDVLVQLAKQERELRGYGSCIVLKIQDLLEYRELLPKLSSIASQIEEKDDKGNTCLLLFARLAKNGEYDAALRILSEAEKITYCVYNRDFKLACKDENLTNQTLEQIRRIGSEQEPERLVLVATELFDQERLNEAKTVANEAWEKSKHSRENYQDHDRNIVEYFLDLTRDTELTFDNYDHQALLDIAKKAAIDKLNTAVPGESLGHWKASFANSTVFELAKSGRYEEAEELTILIDQKARINYWGELEARRMRPEERDKAYKQIAVAAAIRKDYEQIENYLSKMIEYKPDAMLRITKILAEKGDFESSFMASFYGAEQIVNSSGFSVDKNDIGVSTRLLPMGKGDAAMELGLAMLKSGGDLEKAAKVLKFAATEGLGDRNILKVVESMRPYPQLSQHVLELLQIALEKDGGGLSFAYKRDATVLESLRILFPELRQYEPRVNN